MLRMKNFICTIAIIGLSITYVFAQKKCMLIGATPGRENSTWDKYIIPQLKEWGYEVDKKHNSTDIPNYTEADYAKYDFIFLSETVHSSLMEPLRSIPLPMMNSDGWGAQETALSFTKGRACNMITPEPIKFTDEGKGHPLAAGFAPGTVTDVCKGKHIVWSTPSIPVIPIAGVASDMSKLMVYGIEKGTKNVLGDEIKHRVAVFGVHAFGYNSLTENSVKIFKAGIEWVLAEGTTSNNAKKEINSAHVNLSRKYKNSSFSLTYFVPEQSKTKLTVWNGAGQKIQTLVNDVRVAGEHTVSLNVSNMPSGIYLFNLEVGNTNFIKKIPFTN